MTIAWINDASHLIKAMRNALMNSPSGYIEISDHYVKELQLPSNKVKWHHIVQLVNHDYHRVLKVAPHLNKKHIDVGHFNKMKVGLAKAVLSRATGKALRELHDKNPQQFPKEVLTTAEFCEKVGYWDALVNNHHRNMAFHKNNEEKNEESEKYLDYFRDFYCSLKLHPNQNVEKKVLKPSQKGVIVTNDSLKWLKKKLFDANICFEYFLTGKCTNDPCEQFHGEERSIQKNPTAIQFKRNAKIISVSDYMGNVAHANVEVDQNATWLTDLQDLKNVENEHNKEHIETKADIDFLKAKKITDTVEQSSLAYLSGYILKKTIAGKKSTSQCPECEKAFVVSIESDDQSVNSLITLKEYKEDVLVRPSKVANQMFLQSETIFRNNVKLFPTGTGLIDLMQNAIVEHIKAYFPSTIPHCHLSRIFRKFAKSRLYFEGEFKSAQLLVKNKKEIEGKAYASKSSKGVSLK